MAAWWRFCRHCRFQAPSRIPNRNRNILYVVFLIPFLMTFLLIPGGEIANYKYTGELSSGSFVTTFPRHGGDGSDDVVRETRSVAGKKLVLLWTGFFESRTWSVTGDAFEGCPVSSCELTLDRQSVVDAADAVLFNARGLVDSSELPQHQPWQVWILHNSEPPYQVYVNLRHLDNVFNWTSWYRTDADIYSPYGTYGQKKEPQEGLDYHDKANGLDNGQKDTALVNMTNVNGDEDDDDSEDGSGDGGKNETASGEEDVYRLHDRVLFFAASNCRDRGRRYKKVAQLKKYLPIDEYGDCGTYHCPKGSDQCEKLFARYQFVLAFENGYCRDYVTEKLWGAYRRLQIPIVSGGADYRKFAIPGSYIDYDNFSSVEELASHVHRVSTDPALYNSYFAWRRSYEPIRAPVANWCQICERLHDKGREPQVYRDLAGWVAQDSCPLFTKYQDFWTHVYLGVFKVLGI